MNRWGLPTAEVCSKPEESSSSSLGSSASESNRRIEEGGRYRIKKIVPSCCRRNFEKRRDRGTS